VSERPKEHASKACEVQASVGSNPTATASQTTNPRERSDRGFVVCGAGDAGSVAQR
jgi:hypothetical protein